MAETRSIMQEVAPKLATLTADVLFGDVWERPELSKRDRSLITVAYLALTLEGERLTQWGDPMFRSCHGIAGDSHRDIYVVQPIKGLKGRRIVKYLRQG